MKRDLIIAKWTAPRTVWSGERLLNSAIIPVQDSEERMYGNKDQRFVNIYSNYYSALLLYTLRWIVERITKQVHEL